MQPEVADRLKTGNHIATIFFRHTSNQDVPKQRQAALERNGLSRIHNDALLNLVWRLGGSAQPCGTRGVTDATATPPMKGHHRSFGLARLDHGFHPAFLHVIFLDLLRRVGHSDV